MTTIDAIAIHAELVATPAGAVAYKYADPIEDACWLYDVDQARRVSADDPSLIVWAVAD